MTNTSQISVYLDNAATSFPKPPEVIDAVTDAMRNIGASPGRGGYGKSLAASMLLLQAREQLSTLFNLPDSSRMLFTSSTTMSLNIAFMGTLNQGDHVITTSMEHNSLLRPLFMLQKNGVQFDMIQADGEGLVNPDDLKKALRPNTRMIAIAHVSNVTGSIQAVKEISDIAREASVTMLLDAAQSAGSISIDMQEMGVDILAAPGHKGLMGPQGTGILALMPNMKLRPVIAGGTGSSSDMDEQPSGFPEGFEAGTHNLPGIAGLGAAASFIIRTGINEIANKERDLCGYLKNSLLELDGCRVYGPSARDRAHGVVSVTLEGIDPSSIAYFLDSEFGISIRSGLHCAPRAHRTIGTYPEGTARISPGWFNTKNDIDILIDALKTIKGRAA